MLLVGADDNIILRQGRLANGFYGVFEKLFADVELVIGLSSGFFELVGFGSCNVFDVSDSISHGAHGLGNSAGCLSCETLAA